MLHASGRTSCGLTFGSVGERGSFGRYLRKPPAPWAGMGQMSCCIASAWVALLSLGHRSCCIASAWVALLSIGQRSCCIATAWVALLSFADP